MEPTLGEIRLFAGNFAPRGWALCEGQLLAISQNDALFSLLGTIYGGDGRTTFALPDLRGRIPVGAGSGPGLSSYRIGAKGGMEDVTLSIGEIPSHSHPVLGNNGVGNSISPKDTYFAVAAEDEYNSNKDALMGATNNDGGSREHTNVQAFLALNYIIAIQGIYPSRT